MKTGNGLPLQDWRLIQGPILGFAAATLFSGGILLFSTIHLQHSTARLQSGQGQLDTLHSALAASLRNYQAAEQGKAHYLALQTKGALRHEHRLEWLEALEAARKQAGIRALRYRIDAQKPYGPRPAAAHVQLYVTPMHLQYQARHEESFSSIQRRISSTVGHAVMHRCQFARLPPAEAPGLNVDCDYLWFSLAPAPAPTKGKQ